MPNASGTVNEEGEVERVVNSCKILFKLLVQPLYGSIMRKTAASEVKKSCSLNTCGTTYDGRPPQCLTSSRSRGWWSTCKNQETPDKIKCPQGRRTQYNREYSLTVPSKFYLVWFMGLVHGVIIGDVRCRAKSWTQSSGIPSDLEYSMILWYFWRRILAHENMTHSVFKAQVSQFW